MKLYIFEGLAFVFFNLFLSNSGAAVELEFVQIARGETALRITGPITERSADLLAS